MTTPNPSGPYGLTHQVTIPASLITPAHSTSYDRAAQLSLVDGYPLADHPNRALGTTTSSTTQTGPEKNDTSSDDDDELPVH